MQTYWKPGRSSTLKTTEDQVKGIFRSVFPGRNIIGIDAENVNLWGGGIHCITQHMPVNWGKSGDAREIIGGLFDPAGFSRLYFGQEFYERAIPGVEDLVEAVGESRRNKMDFTLVTPYVTEKGLVKLKALLEELVSRKPG